MDTVDDVLQFVEENPEYRAQIGVIKTDDDRRTYLTWAAIHADSSKNWVPALRTMLKLNPSAHWVPLTRAELRDYLQYNNEQAFLLSEHRMKQRIQA